MAGANAGGRGGTNPFGGANGTVGGRSAGGAGATAGTAAGGRGGAAGSGSTSGKGGSGTGVAGRGGAGSGSGGTGSAGKGGSSAGTGSGSTCSNPIEMTDGAALSINTMGPACVRVTEQVDGWGCSNDAGRTVSVNGTAVTCGQMPLPARMNGAYYFSFTAGTYSYAALYYWP
jgi:hypothetical protein